MKKKIRVALLFGGKSAEHEVSLQSAKNIAEAMDRKKYDITFIGIDKNGRWLSPAQSRSLLTSAQFFAAQKAEKNNEDNIHVALIAEGDGKVIDTTASGSYSSKKIDVVFPVLHGPFGEDGTVQGLLKLAHVPFVGAGVLGSAIGMDKDIMKRLLKEAGLPIGKFLTIKKASEINFKEAVKKLGLPFFVKPANLGSSIGITKVKDQKEYKEALEYAFKFDTKVLLEEFIEGREIECSVLGNEKPRASVPGEVIVNHEFYSYNAKYLDDHGATLQIPADLPRKTIEEIQDLAVKTFQTLNSEGMARVDFFLTKKGKVYINEINTIPGFTSISMYPKLWAASGISNSKLIDKLIEFAIERFEKENKLKVSV